MSLERQPLGARRGLLARGRITFPARWPVSQGSLQVRRMEGDAALAGQFHLPAPLDAPPSPPLPPPQLVVELVVQLPLLVRQAEDGPDAVAGTEPVAAERAALGVAGEL